MTAPFIGTTAPRSDGHVAEVVRLYQEGIIAETLGAATIALWFLVLDILAGRPLYTPNVLGTALFKGTGGLVPPAYIEISLGIVVAFTAVHWLVFALIGGLASRLLGLVEHNPNLGFGVLLLFVLFEGGFVSAAMLFAEPVLHALAWQSVLIGNLLAALVMGGYLWRRHPHIVMYP
jgi:hypothetical protein